MRASTPGPARIRVLMIAPYPRQPDRVDGGVAAATTYLSRALAARDDVDLIGARIIGHGDESRVHADFPWPIVDIELGRLGLSSLFYRQRMRLARLIERFRPDVVHAQGADLAGFMAVGCGVPSVVTVHGLLAECARYQTGAVAWLRASLSALLTERHTIRRAEHLITISPYVETYYRDQIRGRIYDLPNPVAPAFFALERRPEKGRLLYAGRIANGKGLRELLRAVKRNVESVSRLVLAGAAPDPAYATMLRAEATELGLTDTVDFAGLLPEESLLREFSRAEALVLPSHQETAPMVVQQAMAAGLAVLATRIGGIPHQVRHEESGLLFEAGDEAQLAALIRRLAQEAGLSDLLGAAGRKRAASAYQASVVASETSKIYRSVARGAATKSA